MGKSPVKWIKMVLFGKNRPDLMNRKTTNDKGNMEKGSPVFVGSQVISEPVLVNTESNGIVPELGNGTPSNSGEGVNLPTTRDVEKQGSTGTGASNDPEKFRDEEAAIKAQAAFWAYLVLF